MQKKLYMKNEVYKIVGCAFEALNILGHGFLEKPYENALAVEFRKNNIPYKQQPSFAIIYKNENIGTYIPDFIVYNKIIVETKIVDRITNIERAQTINYLKITGLKLGLILNFKHPSLEWERLIR